MSRGGRAGAVTGLTRAIVAPGNPGVNWRRDRPTSHGAKDLTGLGDLSGLGRERPDRSGRPVRSSAQVTVAG